MNSDNDENSKYGPIIKKMRLQRGMSQIQVAAAIQVSPGYLSNVENNRLTMSLSKLILFAKLMEMSLDELVGVLIPEYKKRAVEHQLCDTIKELTPLEQSKLLEIIRILKA